jgi:hypothetical protein
MIANVSRLVCLTASLTLASTPLSFAFGENLHPNPASRGCPLTLTVEVHPVGELMPLGDPRKVTNRLHIVLRGEIAKQIAGAELTVHGLAGSFPASATQRIKTFHLIAGNQTDGALTGDITLNWSNVDRVSVDLIEYASNPVWRASQDQYCVAVPTRKPL